MRLKICRSLFVFLRRAGVFFIVWFLGAVLLCPSVFAKEKPATATTKSDPSASKQSDDSKRLLAEFRETYALPDGKVLKRIAPPFTPGRMEYYRVRNAHQAKILPNKAPTAYWFRWGDGDPKVIDRFREGKITGGGLIYCSEGGYSVANLIGSFTRMKSFDIEGEAKLKWTSIPGDWVMRKGADPQKILQDLETILREECKLPVKLSLVEKDRKVIVVKGKYAYHPLPGKGTVEEDRVYGYEGSYLQDYDQLVLDERDKDLKARGNKRSGRLASFFASLSWILDRPVVDGGVELPKDMLPKDGPAYQRGQDSSIKPHLFEWQWSKSRFCKARKKGDLDEAAILKNLGKQTGLQFVEEPRRRRTVVIERVELRPEENVKTLVQGMIRRRNAIKTGTFKYRWGLATVDDITKPGPWEMWKDFKGNKPRIMTLAGKEWIVQWQDSTAKRMHRKSFDANYWHVPQKNGPTIHKCSISAPDAKLNIRIAHSVSFRILVGGVIPCERLMNYLKHRQKKAVYRGKVAVDGEQTHLLEWTVPKRDYVALGAMRNPALSEFFDSALLRVYIIPEKGYVVRRLDLCTPEGKDAIVANRYESANFKEVAKGIYFPRNYYWIRNYVDFKPFQGYSVDQFMVDEITGVNKPVPESAFEMTIPKRTLVSDHRSPGGINKVYTKKAITFSRADDLVREIKATKDAQKPASK